MANDRQNPQNLGHILNQEMPTIAKKSKRRRAKDYVRWVTGRLTKEEELRLRLKKKAEQETRREIQKKHNQKAGKRRSRKRRKKHRTRRAKHVKRKPRRRISRKKKGGFKDAMEKKLKTIDDRLEKIELRLFGRRITDTPQRGESGHGYPGSGSSQGSPGSVGSARSPLANPRRLFN
jgi:hypothetical protein